MNQPFVVLASASPRRAELLEQMGVRYTQEVAQIDESVDSGESPGDYVVRMAVGKCRKIWQKQPERVVLGADTVVIVDQQILGKPLHEEHHAQMFAQLSDRTHDVLTAVSVAHKNQMETKVSRSEVTFGPLSAELAHRYWLSGEPQDKAGGYAVQGRAAMFIKRLNGSYSGVMGLPIETTAKLLHAVGVDLWND